MIFSAAVALEVENLIGIWTSFPYRTPRASIAACLAFNAIHHFLSRVNRLMKLHILIGVRFGINLKPRITRSTLLCACVVDNSVFGIVSDMTTTCLDDFSTLLFLGGCAGYLISAIFVIQYIVGILDYGLLLAIIFQLFGAILHSIFFRMSIYVIKENF